MAFASDGTFLFKWGSGPSAATGQFNRPHDIAVGPTGDIFVLDTVNNRVQRFTASGVHVSSFSVGSGGMIYGLHVDTAGNVYVADSGGTGSVRKYGSSGGAATLTITDIAAARDVVTDSDGNIYVTSQTGNTIRKYPPTGGSAYTTFTGLQGPRCLSINASGTIYVTEFTTAAGVNRVSSFTTAGVLVNRWGSPGSLDGQFNGDIGIAVGPDGSVYVTEIGNNRVQKFTATGGFLTKWGSAGSGDSQFNGARGIAVNAAGDAYVADTDNHRVQVFGTTAPPPVVSTSASSPWTIMLAALLGLAVVGSSPMIRKRSRARV
jgi:streptogramin lyase